MLNILKNKFHFKTKDKGNKYSKWKKQHLKDTKYLWINLTRYKDLKKIQRHKDLHNENKIFCEKLKT